MELLYFLGKDTPLNVVSDSSRQTKAPPPAINIHIRTGGVDMHSIEEFLSKDHDMFDDMIYLTIPQSFMKMYQETTAVKWLFFRVHNDVCHALLCDASVFDKVHHRPYFKWLKPSSIVQELLLLHSPYARIISNKAEHNVDCSSSSTTLSCHQRFINLATCDASSASARTFAGAIFIDEAQSIPSSMALEFITYVNCEPTASTTSNYSYRYGFSNMNIFSKRPLSSIVSSYRQLVNLPLIVPCKDLQSPQQGIIKQLQDMQLAFELVTATHFMPTSFALILYDNIQLHNSTLLINYLRKLPSIDTFRQLLLHNDLVSEANPYGLTPLYDDISSNEAFAVCHQDHYLQLNEAAKAYVYTANHTATLIPFVCPCYQDMTVTSQDLPKESYYIDVLGDDDLAEQMTQYASVVKGFCVAVNYHKDAWKQIRLKQAFQNIVYQPSMCSSKQSFTIAHYPTPYAYIFHSSIYLRACNYLSTMQFHRYKCVAVHQKRNKYSMSLTNTCSKDYYKKAIKMMKDNLHPTPICFLICNSDAEPTTIEKQDDLQSLLTSKDTMKVVREDDVTTLAIMTLCDGLILSTSSYAWWAAVLNEKASLVIAPERWTNAEHWYHSIEWERRFNQVSWVTLPCNE